MWNKIENREHNSTLALRKSIRRDTYRSFIKNDGSIFYRKESKNEEKVTVKLSFKRKLLPDDAKVLYMIKEKCMQNLLIWIESKSIRNM